MRAGRRSCRCAGAGRRDGCSRTVVVGCSRRLSPRMLTGDGRPSPRTSPLPSAPPPAEQARSMVYITDEAWLDATERQQVMGRRVGSGWVGRWEWMWAWMWMCSCVRVLPAGGCIGDVPPHGRASHLHAALRRPLLRRHADALLARLQHEDLWHDVRDHRDLPNRRPRPTTYGH